jgi:hypothetical protein
MKTLARLVPAAAALAVASAALAAPAAAPKKNGLYSGSIPGQEKRLEVHVSPDGKSATAAMFCFNTKVGSLARFPVAGGAFRASKKTGSMLVWAISGKFTSATKGRASIALNALCDGKGGLVTLTLRS